MLPDLEVIQGVLVRVLSSAAGEGSHITPTVSMTERAETPERWSRASWKKQFDHLSVYRASEQFRTGVPILPNGGKMLVYQCSGYVDNVGCKYIVVKGGRNHYRAAENESRIVK